MDMILFDRSIIKSNLNSYQIQKLLGKGQFGAVYLATQLNNQQEVAIKQIFNQPLINPKVKELMNQEISIQKLIKSKHTVQAIESFTDQQYKTNFLVLEYCEGGDLEQLIKIFGPLSESQAIAYLKQLLQAFKDLHQNNCMHRDVKPNNILFSKGQAKLGDFGFAKQLNANNIANTSLGSNITMAPEVFYKEEYSFEADMFSLGVVFYYMMYGEYPFISKSQNPHSLFQEIKAQNINFNLKGITINENTKDLVKQMTAFDKHQRISWLKIYQHPAIQEQSRYPPEILDYARFQTDKNFNRGINEEFYQKNSENLNQQIFQKFEDSLPKNINDIQLQVFDDFEDQEEKLKIEKQKKEEEEKKNQMTLQQKFEEEKQMKLMQQKKQEFETGLKKYFHKRNTNCILIQMLNSIRNLKGFKINYQIPAFLTCKKLIKLIKEYIQTLISHDNIFGMAFFDEFIKSQQYQDLLYMSEEDLQKIRLEYPQILQECKDSIKKLRMNDPRLVSHLESEDCNNQFELQYKECLINYSISLRELKEQQDTVEQRNLFHQIILISDIVKIDSFQKVNFEFNFDQYKREVFQTPFNLMEQKLDEACMNIFS